MRLSSGPLFSLLLAATCLGGTAHAQIQSTCSHLALVSGYQSSVHVYDACDGRFLRLLDPQPDRIKGPQAVKVGPDGLLYVVSEMSAQIHRYRMSDLSFHDTPINVGAGFDLTGIAFRGNTLYAGGYSSNSVRTYSLSGELLGTPVTPISSVYGFDNGMTFGPDGLLYIPGFDSHNVLRHDPVTGQSAVLVPATSGPINPRSILFRPDGETFLVSGEGSGQVIEYRRDNGSPVRTLASGLLRPTGLAWGPDGSLIVVTRNGVVRLDPNSGALRSTLIPAQSGGLRLPTYIALIANPDRPGAQPEVIDQTQVGTQYWVTGAGRLEGRRLLVDDLYSTTGPRFGNDYNPQAKRDKRWGSLEVDFTDCMRASMRWSSTGENSARFGQGQYALERLVTSPGTQRCQQVGFAQSAADNWLQGMWWGGPTRDGEGFMFEYSNDGVVIVTWFTHRPSGI